MEIQSFFSGKKFSGIMTKSINPNHVKEVNSYTTFMDERFSKGREDEEPFNELNNYHSLSQNEDVKPVCVSHYIEFLNTYNSNFMYLLMICTNILENSLKAIVS